MCHGFDPQPRMFEHRASVAGLWCDNGPMTWTFRNRVELQPHCRLEYGGSEWIIFDSGPRKRVKLAGRHINNIPIAQVLGEGIESAAARPIEAPIKDTSRLILSGSG